MYSHRFLPNISLHEGLNWDNVFTVINQQHGRKYPTETNCARYTGLRAHFSYGLMRPSLNAVV